MKKSFKRKEVMEQILDGIRARRKKMKDEL
jgi:hypothetical protein